MTQDLPYVPPEWAPHASIWVGWPHVRAEWGDAFDGARSEIAAFVRAMCAVTPVQIACGSREAYTSAWLMLDDTISAGKVRLHTVLAGDIWLRDTGPIMARAGGADLALNFQFNGWGGKYLIPGDIDTARAIASVEQAGVRDHAFVLEGGAIDLDGTGNLLTTRQCVLNANRNPGWSEDTASQVLESVFGVTRVIWLDDGLVNDHTDGHVDNIARFIGPGRVACMHPSGENDPNRETLSGVERTLRAAGLDVITVPSPGLITDETGTPVPASHMNFVISNETVFLPVYETEYAPRAIAALEAAMPGYNVVALSARNILSGGGAFHCMTQQVPSFEELPS